MKKNISLPVSCRFCGTLVIKKTPDQVVCSDPVCRKKNHAFNVKRTRLLKRKTSAAIRKGMALSEGRQLHLSHRVKLKLIVIELLALEYARARYRARHSQKPLPQETGAMGSIEAVRMISESTARPYSQRQEIL